MDSPPLSAAFAITRQANSKYFAERLSILIYSVTILRSSGDAEAQSLFLKLNFLQKVQVRRLLYKGLI